jgi:hypothetical protein
MKNVTKIVMMAFCAALALSSCRKDRHNPAGTQLGPLEFAAVSQNSMVKADGDLLSDYYDDFGVWGVARHDELEHPYILWTSDALELVNQVAGTNNYVPVNDAYWLYGYEYEFIAIAPYEAVASASVADDILTVTVDLSDKYEAAEDVAQYDAVKDLYKYENAVYGFDVMSAVAETDAIGTQKPVSQSLTFWHLMSKITITIKFRDDIADAEGKYPELDGDVTKVVITGLDSQGQYLISQSTDNPNVPSVTTLSSESAEEPAQETITYDNLSDEDVRFNMLPQNVSDMKMSLDFTITKNGSPASTAGYMLDLSSLSVQDYLANQSYNWKITITPQYIYFADGENEPTVQKWVAGAQIPSVDIK